MINVNLLPKEMRKKEGLPVPHFAGLLVVLALVLGVGYAIFDYETNVIPSLEANHNNLQRQLRDLQTKAADLNKINAEIAKINGFVNSVRELYRQRVVWSKILSDLKSIANFDPVMNSYNSDMRYLWFTNLTGSGKTINLTGFATASTQVLAMQMPERLLQGFQTYSPASLPEKGEEERLQEQLKAVMLEYANLRQESPSLPLQSPDEIAIRQRLEDIKNLKSGGIALMPFSQLLVPGSIRLLNATWTGAPQPRVRTNESFPTRAWSFGITMTLK